MGCRTFLPVRPGVPVDRRAVTFEREPTRDGDEKAATSGRVSASRVFLLTSLLSIPHARGWGVHTGREGSISGMLKIGLWDCVFCLLFL